MRGSWIRRVLLRLDRRISGSTCEKKIRCLRLELSEGRGKKLLFYVLGRWIGAEERGKTERAMRLNACVKGNTMQHAQNLEKVHKQRGGWLAARRTLQEQMRYPKSFHRHAANM